MKSHNFQKFLLLLKFQHTSERDLRKLFGEYGEIESVQIVYDRFTGRSRGFGFVYFTSTKDATRVLFFQKYILVNLFKFRQRII